MQYFWKIFRNIPIFPFENLQPTSLQVMEHVAQLAEQLVPLVTQIKEASGLLGQGAAIMNGFQTMMTTSLHSLVSTETDMRRTARELETSAKGMDTEFHKQIDSVLNQLKEQMGSLGQLLSNTPTFFIQQSTPDEAVTPFKSPSKRRGGTPKSQRKRGGQTPRRQSKRGGRTPQSSQRQLLMQNESGLSDISSVHTPRNDSTVVMQQAQVESFTIEQEQEQPEAVARVVVIDQMPDQQEKDDVLSFEPILEVPKLTPTETGQILEEMKAERLGNITFAYMKIVHNVLFIEARRKRQFSEERDPDFVPSQERLDEDDETTEPVQTRKRRRTAAEKLALEDEDFSQPAERKKGTGKFPLHYVTLKTLGISFCI